MFFPETNIRIWLCASPTDMRKSFDGLAALAKNCLKEEPTSCDLFVFTNKKRNYLKLLYFDRTGYCLWAKRLEAGQYHLIFSDRGIAIPKRKVDLTQLKMMLEGIVEKDFKKRKRYKK
jgi:transposase